MPDLFEDGWKKLSQQYYSDSEGDYKFDENARPVSDIDYSKFTTDAVVELHGCLMGAQTYLVDHIAQDLSEKLHS